MTAYELFLFLHIACVVAWVGAGTTLALLSMRMPISESAEWLGPRLFGPSSLGALAFGIALVFKGNWTFAPLWIQLGLAAFALSTLLNVGVRLPLHRRLEGDPVGVQRNLARLARVELTLLYLTVADMVIKPSSSDPVVLAVGGALLAGVAAVGVIQARTGRTGT
jgi:hypothetical protein